MKPQTLKDHEFIFESIFYNSSDGLAYCQMIFDPQGLPVDFVFKLVNKSFELLTGFKAVTGKKISEIILGVALSKPELLNIFGRVSLSGRSEQFEIYLESKKKWFLVTIICPQKEFFIVILRNITKQKLVLMNLEDARIAAQNVLEDFKTEKSKMEIAEAKEIAILMSIGEGLVSTDEKGIIILMNKTAEKLLGFKNKEVIGKVYTEIFPIEDEKGIKIPIEKQPINMALATTTTTTIGNIYYYVRKNKTKFPVAIVVTPVILNGKIIGTIQVFRDITYEKEIDRAKTEFVSMASHQLKTPLSITSWFIEMLTKKEVGELNGKQKEYLEEIYQSNKRMIKLVNDLLNISRLETGRLKIEPKPMQFENIIEDTIKNEKNLITTKRCQVSFNKPKIKLPLVSLDESLIRQIVYNLLTNAIHYSKMGKGKILIKLERLKDKNYLLTISDNGIGIPKREHRHIFERFFRAGNAQKMSAEGTGLGLYISKMIIEFSGGKIWFESEKNQGTKFYVSIPSRGMTGNKGDKPFTN